MTKREDLKKKISELQSGWIRTQADFDNYKKKTEADKASWTKVAKEDTLFEILPILDNLYFAFKHQPQELEGNSWVQGINHIANQIDQKLNELGIERITPQKKEVFSPQLHEALATEKTKGAKPDTILELIRPGYKIGEKIIRPAQVKVSK
jgi:molecular chaperone GrpE